MEQSTRCTLQKSIRSQCIIVHETTVDSPVPDLRVLHFIVGFFLCNINSFVVCNDNGVWKRLYL